MYFNQKTSLIDTKNRSTKVVINDPFGDVCDVIRGALGGAQAHRRQCVPNPRLHEPRSKPYLFNVSNQFSFKLINSKIKNKINKF